MKKIFHIASLLLSALIFQSCEEVIILDIPEGEKRLVVESQFTNQDTTHFVKLSLTGDYFDYNPTPRVSGAIVFIIANGKDTLPFIEGAPGTGYYYSGFKAEDSVEYKLFIQLPGGKQYISDPEFLNRVNPIDSIVQSDEAADSVGFFEGGYYVYIETTEPAGVGDFYRWVMFVNGEKLIGAENLWVENDELVDGQEIKDFNRLYGLKPGDRVEFWQMSISEKAYHYWYLLREQISIFGSPFDSPPSPIEGNMRCLSNPNEDVFGLFSVCKVEKKKYLVVQK